MAAIEIPTAASAILMFWVPNNPLELVGILVNRSRSIKIQYGGSITSHRYMNQITHSLKL